MCYAADISHRLGEDLEPLLRDGSPTAEAAAIHAFPQALDRFFDLGEPPRWFWRIDSSLRTS